MDLTWFVLVLCTEERHFMKFPSVVLIYRYIDLYKLKFPKKDHVLLVKLLYELLTIPNLPIHMISVIQPSLCQLLQFV